jgi:hypothetical protein
MAGQLRRERLRRRTTDEIIGAARLLLEKDGPSAISVRAIARQVGLTGPRDLPLLPEPGHAYERIERVRGQRIVRRGRQALRRGRTAGLTGPRE